MHRRRKTHLLPFLLLLAAALLCCAQSYLGGAAAAILKNHACWSLTSFRGKICLAWQWGQTPDPRRWQLSLFQPLPQNAPITITSATASAAFPDNLTLLRAANQNLLAAAATSSSALGFHLTTHPSTHSQITNDQVPITRSLFVLAIPAWFYLLVPAILVALAARRYRKSPRPLTAALRRIDCRIRRRAPWILAAFVLAAGLFLETRRRPPANDIFCTPIQPNLPRPSASAQENAGELAAHNFRIATLTEPRHSLSSTASRNARAQILLRLFQTAVPPAARGAAEARATHVSLDIHATPAQADYLAALFQALQP